MTQWDSVLYLKYEQERTQPSRDLAARLPRKELRASSTSAVVRETARMYCGAVIPAHTFWEQTAPKT